MLAIMQLCSSNVVLQHQHIVKRPYLWFDPVAGTLGMPALLLLCVFSWSSAGSLGTELALLEMCGRS